MSVIRVRPSASTIAIVALCLMAFAITACSGGGASASAMPMGAYCPPWRSRTRWGRSTQSISDAARGECGEQTLDVLTCFSYRGHGYEGAQTALRPNA